MRWWNQTGVDWGAEKTRGGGGETDSTSILGSTTDGEEERKEEKGAEELGEAKEDIGEGGSDGADIGGFLQGRGATSPIIRGRDMGSNAKDGKGAKRISTRGG